MRASDIVMMAIPVVVGVILLIFRMNELRFYSFESPIAWSFLAFGVAIGIFVMSVGEKPKESVLGVPVK